MKKFTIKNVLKAINQISILCVVLFLTGCLAPSGTDYNGRGNGNGNGNGVNGNGNINRLESSDQTPIAVSDEVITDPFEPISINVLANDFGLGDTPLTISVTSLPEYGNVAVDGDNAIIFTPTSGYVGNDSFSYQITDNNGDTATAVVSLDLRCNDCSSNTMISLSWRANAESVEGYIVNYGSSATTTNLTALVVANDAVNFDPRNPSVQIDTVWELGLNPGEPVCFRIKAYNPQGESGFSDAICTTA